MRVPMKRISRAITHQDPFLFICITSIETGKFRKL
jgi:hypothetical protein